MSTIKVDTIATRTGSGNITLSNSLASATIAGDLTVDTSTLKVDAANNRVGIGTASPSTNLDITASGGQVTVDANGHITSKQSLDAATAGGRIIGASNRGTVSQIDLAQTTSSADGGYIRFLTCDSGSTNPTERMRLLSGGGLTFNGDTAAANALDDYEEGTWTPTLDFNGGSTGITYSTQSAKYTKIGNVVHFSFRIYLSNKGSSGGHAHVGGFPFPSDAMPAGGVFQLTPSRGWLGDNDEPIYLYFSGGSRMAMYQNDWDGTANTAATDSQFANNTELELTASYFTNS